MPIENLKNKCGQHFNRRFTRSKCKVLYIGWNNSIQQYRSGNNCIRSSFEEMDGGGLVDKWNTNWLNMKQSVFSAKKEDQLCFELV